MLLLIHVIYHSIRSLLFVKLRSKVAVYIALGILLPTTAYAAPKVNNYYRATKLESHGDNLFEIADYQAALDKYKHSKNKWQDKTIEAKIEKVKQAIVEAKEDSTKGKNEEKVLGASDKNQSTDTVTSDIGSNKKYPTPTSQPPTPTPTSTSAPTSIILQNKGTGSTNNNSASGRNKREGKTVRIRPTFPIPTSSPCVCIESWGAGDFVGNCRGVDASCIIKYSCLLPDKKRLGVWNNEQTECLEEHVRYVGDQSANSKPQTNPGPSQNECNKKQKTLQAERDNKIAQVNTANDEFVDSIGEDYARRGMFDSGVRRTEQGKAKAARNDSIERIENEYQQKLSELKNEGCKF